MTRNHPSNLQYIFTSFWHHKDLAMRMIVREVVGRYRGSAVGLLWSFFHPLMMLAVYTFVFSFVFSARWGSVTGGRADFALFAFAGMVVHSLFAECINRAPRLVLENPNYVKKVIFPLEVLPWVSLGSALFHSVASVLVLLGFLLVLQQHVSWTAALLPVVLVPFILFIMGLSWWLASTGVYLRDIGQMTGVINSILMFLSPVFFPVTALPEKYQLLMHLNPLTFIIEQARDVLIWGKMPNWQGLAIYWAAGILCAWAGLAWFQKTRKGFADVL